jgi:hypothetical protein
VSCAADATATVAVHNDFDDSLVVFVLDRMDLDRVVYRLVLASVLAGLQNSNLDRNYRNLLYLWCDEKIEHVFGFCDVRETL